MRKPNFTKPFEKDVKRMRKRGKNLQKLNMIMTELIFEKPLEKQYKDHILIGNYKGRRECHIDPNWLLIYKLSDDEIIFERTGTHSDLFE